MPAGLSNKDLAVAVSAVLLAVLVSSCSTLPEVQPFTDATISLRSAVASSGGAVAGELERVEIRNVREEAKKLQAAWNERNKLFSALVEYASSVQAIVDSGKSGADTAKALADSVTQLAKLAGIVQPGAAEASSVVTEAAMLVYGQIAKARAAASLEKALAEAQPAIERIALVIADDMSELRKLVGAAGVAQRNELRLANAAMLGYRGRLNAVREELLNRMNAALAEGKKPSELEETKELERLSELMSATESSHGPLQEELKNIAQRERLTHQLITETQAALADWSAAHARLLTAVRTKRVPTATELGQAADRIRELVEKFRSL